jgi:hypothetical protein
MSFARLGTGEGAMAADTSTDHELGDAGSLFVEEQRFAIVAEWVIDSELSDAAFRLYSLLLRYGNGSGCRMPSRSLLARRLHRSVDSVDRAMRELVSHGVVRVEHRHDGTQNLTNRYHVRTSSPTPVQTRRSEGGRISAATPGSLSGGSRRSAATPGRTVAVTLAADLRPNREISTDTPPPPPHRHASPAPSGPTEEEAGADLLAVCGIENFAALAGRCASARIALGQSPTRWTEPCLLAAIQLAVKVRQWPPQLVEPALLYVAADTASRSPMRVAEAGPWWESAGTAASPSQDDVDIAPLEERLLELDGGRIALQRKAREELTAEGRPLSRLTVARRACEILDRREVG